MKAAKKRDIQAVFWDGGAESLKADLDRIESWLIRMEQSICEIDGRQLSAQIAASVTPKLEALIDRREAEAIKYLEKKGYQILTTPK